MKLSRRYLTSKTGQFILFKYTIYSLLAFNIYLFSINGTFTETIDTAAWVIILALFEWETRSMGKPYATKIEPAIIALLSTFGYSVILYSCYSYYLQQEWIDFANALTWILVVLVLQYDVYFPKHYSKIRWIIHNVIKTLLYTGLLVFAVMWGFEGEILDFYDAFLWILSFVVIELNVFKFEHKLKEEVEKRS